MLEGKAKAIADEGDERIRQRPIGLPGAWNGDRLASGPIHYDAVSASAVAEMVGAAPFCGAVRVFRAAVTLSSAAERAFRARILVT